MLEAVEDFEIYVPNIDEDALTSSDPVETAESLAKAKALSVLKVRPDCLVIGGDTVVALPKDDGKFQQLAKPSSAKDAEKMLKQLSGKSHLVISGVCIAWEDGVKVFSDTSHVTFKELSAAEIKAYVKTGEPLDKAGGYACQGGAKTFIEKLEGSEFNVIGLPLEKLKDALAEFEE